MSTKVEEQTHVETQGKHYVVDARNITPLDKVGGNPRTDYGEKDGSFKELVESIREHGVTESIKAYRDPENPGKWKSISGHTRIKACSVLWKEGIFPTIKVIPVDVRKLSNLSLLFETVIGNKGRQLNTLELCEVVKRCLAEGAKTKEIATGLSMTPHAIKNLELLASSPKRIRDLISENVLSYTVALDFIKTSTNFNEAIEKIENALGKVSSKKSAPAQKNDIEDESPEEEKESVKITRRDLNEANNKNDSIFELRKVFKEQIDNPKTVTNNDLYFFAKMIVENKYTAADFKKRFFS